MDLRKQASAVHVDRAKSLAMRGLMNYQPFRLSERFYCGAGLSILEGLNTDPPTVLCPDLDRAMSEYAAKALSRPEDSDTFIRVNDQMDAYYAGMLDQIRHQLNGSFNGITAMEAGCNAGYFPVALSKAGATRAVGYDRVDYTETINLLNDICGTKAEFKQWSYDGGIKAQERFDLVLSVAVVCHLSDPLHHLAWLGSAATKHLLVLAPCHQDDDYSIRHHAVNRYYKDSFPYCFDFTTISQKLLRLAFEQMGFSKVVEIETDPMPLGWKKSHLALFGTRSSETVSAARGIICNISMT